MRTYSELIRIPTFEERLEYLRLKDGKIGMPTFGKNRYVNQSFYQSSEWKSLRHKIIVRDNACDLAMDGYEIYKRPYIHHINPVTLEQLINHDPIAWDPENLVTVSYDTHTAIHFGTEALAAIQPTVRTPFDTCPWKGVNPND